MKDIIKITTFISKQIIDIRTYGIRELFRKFYLLIIILAPIPMDIIAIVPCVIIRLIRPWIIIRIERVAVSNFGNFAHDPAVYSLKKKLKIDLPTKKHIDLLYIHYKDKIYNRQLAKMWKRKLNFFPGYLLDPINRVNKFIPGWKIHTIKILSDGSASVVDLSAEIYVQNANNSIEKYQPLDFTPDEETHGKELLKKFGLHDDDKFVCLAVRDAAYQLMKISSRFRDWSYHNYRNYDIDDFVMAAESLAERGYYVFRMGVVVEKSLNTKNEKIIDYANSNLRSDFLDVYLAAKCSFCLSTGLGFDNMASTFRRPLALIQCPLGDICQNRFYNKNSLVITKHHILKKENRRLSLSEIFSHGVAYAYKTEIFRQKGIELVDNTPNEIKDLAIEMVESVEFKKKLNPQDEKLQKTFKNLFASNMKRVVHPNVAAYRDIKKNYRKDNDQVKICYGTKFLKENKNWLR